jgi:nitrate/nitrite transport system permease protein
MSLSVSARSAILSIAILAVFLVLWHIGVQPRGGGGVAVDPEYAALVGAAAATGGQTPMPGPLDVGATLLRHLADPFHVRGTNDMGIGIQLGYSIGRVLAGFLIAALVAIPLGFLIGMSPLVNTAFGVASVRKEWLNVARTLEVGHVRRAFTIILPAAAPTILTGMRISIGIAWLVIVAAEMLVGGTGIGYFVWNQWNNLSITDIITAILLIGLVGMVLDQLLALATRRVSYPE